MSGAKDDVPATLVDPKSLGNADTAYVSGPKPGGLNESVPSAVNPDVGTLAPEGLDVRYEVKSLLGRGGVGEVSLCHDRRIGRDVALKRLRGEMTGADPAERFVREARVQGQLEHPSVVPVYDISAAANGTVYFTMKRVKGLALDDVLHLVASGDAVAKQKYSRRRLLAAFSSLCLSLDYAHARGVLHRDLKPGNVMLGDYGEVHVLDWGLAKLLGSKDGAKFDEAAAHVEVEKSALGETVHGSLMGTPGYMAPEQARGEIDELDARTDVYSLGAILFEILYGRPLHPQKTPLGRITATMIAPVFPEGRDDVAPELEALCRRAVSPDKKDRHASARELAEALDQYLDGERDEERRRELAQKHVVAARAAQAEHERGDAMRELGRALALDPSHAGALTELRKLLTDIPYDVPPEAVPALERERAPRRLGMARTTGVRLLTWVLAIPAVILFGVSSWTLATTLIASLLGAAAIAFAVRASGKVDDTRAVVLLVATSVAIALMSLIFGPFVLVPSLAATNAMFFASELGRKHRALVVAMAALTVVVPWSLGALGVVAPWYAFTAAGEMVIRSPMVGFPSALTQGFLLVVSTALVVTPTLLAGRARDERERAEERVFLQAWHLGELLPEGTRE